MSGSLGVMDLDSEPSPVPLRKTGDEQYVRTEMDIYDHGHWLGTLVIVAKRSDYYQPWDRREYLVSLRTLHDAVS